MLSACGRGCGCAQISTQTNALVAEEIRHAKVVDTARIRNTWIVGGGRIYCRGCCCCGRGYTTGRYTNALITVKSTYAYKVDSAGTRIARITGRCHGHVLN